MGAFYCPVNPRSYGCSEAFPDSRLRLLTRFAAEVDKQPEAWATYPGALRF